MAHSVEIRVPFVDVGVFSAMQRGVLRGTAPTKARLLKASGTHIESILGTRRKTGFNVPIRDWFIDHGGRSKAERGIRSWARRVLTECSPAMRGGI
jgi:asparagine synthase (glutamine-hydrolysing)